MFVFGICLLISAGLAIVAILLPGKPEETAPAPAPVAPAPVAPAAPAPAPAVAALATVAKNLFDSMDAVDAEVARRLAITETNMTSVIAGLEARVTASVDLQLKRIAALESEVKLQLEAVRTGAVSEVDEVHKALCNDLEELDNGTHPVIVRLRQLAEPVNVELDKIRSTLAGSRPTRATEAILMLLDVFQAGLIR